MPPTASNTVRMFSIMTIAWSLCKMMAARRVQPGVTQSAPSDGTRLSPEYGYRLVAQCLLMGPKPARCVRFPKESESGL